MDTVESINSDGSYHMNKIIDFIDYNKIISFNMGSDTPKTIITSTYASTVYDHTVAYKKYNYATQQEGRYTLSSTTATPTSNTRARADMVDYVNYNTVHLDIFDDDGNHVSGSGFIVDEHVIATAAHCLVFKNSNNQHEYVPHINVEICELDGTTVEATYSAKELHVPEPYIDYLYASSSLRDNYDYGLIYVEEDLSEHGIWNIGHMIPGIETTETSLATHGFTTHNNDTNPTRYYSFGAINTISAGDHNDPNLRFTTSGLSYPGKSGGPVYYQYINEYDEAIETVVGICTGAGTNNCT